jgi:uncharacterized protein YlxW (UPF0749 family)
MSITRFAFWILLASFVLVVGCATPKPVPDQLEQVIARTSVLEQQVRALEQSNAELQMEVRALQERREPREPREPRWSHPQTNGVPHLTPLEIK